MSTIRKWDIFTLNFSSPAPEDPFEPGIIGADFVCGSTVKHVEGFYDGGDCWRIRFMPEIEGEWRWKGFGIAAGEAGTFTCTANAPENHGPSRAAGHDFDYADGTPCIPYGTTCYVWEYQPAEIRAKTLETLKNSPFNKIRMCVFPKFYVYNRKDPDVFPYEMNDDGTINYARPDPEYFRFFESQIEALKDIGVIADIIVFHPYDKWGFSRFPKGMDERYIRYLIARVGAYSNVWWAMANEYDIFRNLTVDDWNRFGNCFMQYDPYDHPRSIHNCIDFFDHSQPWVTHVSAQRVDLYRHVEYSAEYIEKWDKPLVWDEIAYEGNIPDGWGSINGEEMTRRFWESAIRGAYPGHSETYIDEDDGREDKLLWWSHGGELKGTSPARIQFLYDIIKDAPRGRTYDQFWDLPYTHKDRDWFIFYHTFMLPTGRNYFVEGDADYHVEVIDTWNMTIEDRGIVRSVPMQEGEYGYTPGGGKLHVQLPGRQWMAVRLTKV